MQQGFREILLVITRGRFHCAQSSSPIPYSVRGSARLWWYMGARNKNTRLCSFVYWSCPML